MHSLLLDFNFNETIRVIITIAVHKKNLRQLNLFKSMSRKFNLRIDYSGRYQYKDSLFKPMNTGITRVRDTIKEIQICLKKKYLKS